MKRDADNQLSLKAVVTTVGFVLALLITFMLIPFNFGLGQDKIEFVKTTGQLIAGSFVLIGLYFTYESVKASEDTVQLTRESIEQTAIQLTLVQESNERERQAHQTEQLRNDADRFSQAIEQLGHQQASVQIGALHSLERLARDNDDYYDQTIEVISAYIRQKSEAIGAPSSYDLQALEAEGKKYRTSHEIEAAFRIIARRGKALGNGENMPLNLSGANLSGLRLTMAELDYSDLQDTIIIGSEFWDFNFANSNLTRADLRQTVFSQCIFVGTWLRNVKAEGARFVHYGRISNPWDRISLLSIEDASGPPQFTYFREQHKPGKSALVSDGLAYKGSHWEETNLDGVDFTFGDLSEFWELTIEQWESVEHHESKKHPRLKDEARMVYIEPDGTIKPFPRPLS